VALTAWNRELGTTQGRIAPRDFVPPEGDFVFVLGRDVRGFTARFAIGDYVEVKQAANFGDAKLLRFCARLRPPATVPASVAWKATLRIDGSDRASTRLTPGWIRYRVDLAANISKLTGDHELCFRLELVGA